LVGVLLVLFLVLVAFSQSPTPAQSSGQVKTINIGATEVITGPGAYTGLAVKKFLDVLVEDFNKSGGVTIQGQRYNINLIFEDDKWSADGGRAAIEKLVYKDKVSAVVCTAAAAAVMAGLDITEPNKIPFICETGDPRVLDPKYKYVFSTSMLREIYNMEWGWLAKNRPDIKKVMLLATDDIMGHNDVTTQTAAMKAFGIVPMDTLYYARTQPDLSPVGTKVKAANPDTVAGAGLLAGGPQAALLKALYQAGWRGVKTNGPGISMPDNLEIAGKEALEGWVGPIMDASGLSNPPTSYLKLKQLYEAKYGTGSWDRDRVAINIQWVTAWYFLPEALKKANSLSPDAIISALQGMSVDTPIGKLQLIVPPERNDNPRTVECVGEIAMGQIKDGKMNLVGIISTDDALKYIQTVYKRK